MTIQPVCRLGPDRVYVNNLREPSRPKLLTLPRGRGPAFRDDMQVLAGLTTGERVVIDGGEDLEDGARVKESES